MKHNRLGARKIGVETNETSKQNHQHDIVSEEVNSIRAVYMHEFICANTLKI